jgi:hypothetical protein
MTVKSQGLKRRKRNAIENFVKQQHCQLRHIKAKDNNQKQSAEMG